MSASGKITCGFLPPSSIDTFFRVAAPAAIAARPDRRRAGEGDHVDVRVGGHRRADFGAVAGDDIAHALRQARLGEQARRDAASRPSVISLGFTTHAQPAASAKGSFCETISSGKFQGVMIDTTPIGSRSTKPEPVGAEIGVTLAGQFARQRRRVAPDVGRAFDLAARLRDRLAGFERVHERQRLAVAVDQVRDLQKHARAVRGGLVRPRPLVESACAPRRSRRARPPRAPRGTRVTSDAVGGTAAARSSRRRLRLRGRRSTSRGRAESARALRSAWSSSSEIGVLCGHREFLLSAGELSARAWRGTPRRPRRDPRSPRSARRQGLRSARRDPRLRRH